MADASFTTGRCRNGARANLWADRVAEKASVLGSPLVFETTVTSSIPCIIIMTTSLMIVSCFLTSSFYYSNLTEIAIHTRDLV